MADYVLWTGIAFAIIAITVRAPKTTAIPVRDKGPLEGSTTRLFTPKSRKMTPKSMIKAAIAVSGFELLSCLCHPHWSVSGLASCLGISQGKGIVTGKTK